MFRGGDALGSGFAQAERRIADVIARGSDLLSLGGLGLTTLPPSIPSHLRGLDLSGNRLKTLPPNVAGFTNLELLDRGNNRFDVLPPQICELERLISLDLSENRLVELPIQ